jgi:hypothetical protein
MHTLFIGKHKDGILPQVWIIKAAHLRANEVDAHQVARVDRQLAPKRPVLLAAPIRTTYSLKFRSTCYLRLDSSSTYSLAVAWVLNHQADPEFAVASLHPPFFLLPPPSFPFECQLATAVGF